MDSSKRQFLQQLGVLTAGASLVPLAQAQFPFSPERHEGSLQHRYAMLVDLRRCIGCQACTVSCAIENQTPQGEFRTLVNQYQVQIEGQQSVTNVLLPRLCNHCDNPPCVPVCPVQATFQREDGIVVVDNTRCVGCAYCVQVQLMMRGSSTMKHKPPINVPFLRSSPRSWPAPGLRGILRRRRAHHRRYQRSAQPDFSNAA